MKLRPLALLMLPLLLVAQTTAPTTKPSTQPAAKSPTEVLREKWSSVPEIENKEFDAFIDTIPADCWPDMNAPRPRSGKDMQDLAFMNRWAAASEPRAAKVKAWSEKNVLGKQFTFTAIATADSVPNGNEESNRFSFLTTHKGKVAAVILTVGLPRVKVGTTLKITGTYSKTQPFRMGVQPAENTDIIYMNFVLRDCTVEKVN